MKFAIMADVHANLEALQAVLKDSKEQECTGYAFLGDFVRYCADPKACLNIVRALDAPCVKGNFDEYCSGDSPPEHSTRGRLERWNGRESSSARTIFNGCETCLMF